MMASPKGTVSRYSRRRPVDLDDLMFADPERLGEPDRLRPFFAYGRTKNMNAMFVFTLARRLAGTGITVNGAHPGIIAGTGLSREVPGLAELVAIPCQFVAGPPAFSLLNIKLLEIQADKRHH